MLKGHQGVRTLITAMEEDRISASRHILHLQAVKKYMDEKKLKSLTPTDIDTLFNEGVGIDNEDPSAGPNADLSLTSQSLSFNGFSDDDSDYVP